MKKVIILLFIFSALLIACSKQPKTFQGDIEEVLKLGGSYNCTAYKEGEYDLNILIKGTQLKGIASTKEGVIESVGDINECVYGWYQSTKVGQVVCITEEELRKGITLLQKSKDTNITLNCIEYKFDPSVFQKPEDVEFLSSLGPA